MKKFLIVAAVLPVLLFAGCETDPEGNEPVVPGDTTAPATVTLTVLSAGSGKISLSWTEPADADYDHLLLSWSPGGTSGTEIDKGTTFYEITGLSNGTEYALTGKTVDTSGNASAGCTISILVPEDEMDVVYISTVAELAAIDDTPEALNDYYILTADIDLAGTDWEPIGYDPDYNDFTVENSFTGILEGGGYTISNLTIDSTLDGNDQEFLGLFEYLGTDTDSDAAVLNLNITGVNITGSLSGVSLPRDLAGSIAGRNYGTIENCTVSGQIGPGSDGGGGHDMLAGGLVGVNEGYLLDCIADVDITAEGDVAGGLACWNTGGVIRNCAALGDVLQADSASRLGGLLGGMEGAAAVVENCHAEGKVSGDDYIGGLIGSLIAGTVIGSSAGGDISGDFYVGGLVGRVGMFSEDVSITDCHASGSVAGNQYVGGLAGLVEDEYGSRLIKNSHHSNGKIMGITYAGGLVGESDAEISFCYADGELYNFGSMVGGPGWSPAGRREAFR